MARPRGFDEDEVVRLAAAVFAEHAFDGVSVDELVTRLGVHRNSLYKTFGSKRGLYLRALRQSVETGFVPAVARIASRGAGAESDLLLLAAVERAHHDSEVADIVRGALARLDTATGSAETTNTILGARLRERATIPTPQEDA